MAKSSPRRMFDALKAIASMKVDANTDHAQLSALCIAIAKAAAQEWCCGDAACYNKSSGVPCAVTDPSLGGKLQIDPAA